MRSAGTPGRNRRWGRGLAALLVSLAVHASAVGLWLGFKLWQAWPTMSGVDVDVVGTTTLTDLPLGEAAPKAPPAPEPSVGPASPPSRKTPKSNDRDGEKKPASTDGDAPLARPSSLGQYAPEGSRLTALLRVDRLRHTPFAEAVDGILVNLPDRRNLLEGTELDLYRDFDALLIATPNPLDATVTFLAARHRLKDQELRAALERAARATGRALSWQNVGGRPIAERKPSATQGQPASWRDHRLIVLPAAHLVVVTPPAYRDLLLHPHRPTATKASGNASPDGGAADAGSSVDPANADGGSMAPAPVEPDWTQLVRRLDAQDSILPPDAVAMLHGEDILGVRGGQPVPGTRGAADGDDGNDGAPARGSLLGLPVPRVVDLVLGIREMPFAELTARFDRDAQALAWSNAWPELHAKLKGNLLLALSGFGGLIDRVHLEREGAALKVSLSATQEETLRILSFAAAQAAAMRGR